MNEWRDPNKRGHQYANDKCCEPNQWKEADKCHLSIEFESGAYVLPMSMYLRESLNIPSRFAIQ